MAQVAREHREPLWVTALKAGLLVTKFWRRAQHRPPKPPKDKVERGWREVLKILYGHVSEHRLTAIAGGVTYFALLSMFPFVGAIVAIYGLFGDAGALGGHLERLSSILPGGAIEVVGDQLRRAAQGGASTLGLAFLISIAISLWSANVGVKALFDALNIVYESKETRSFVMLNAVSLVFTIAVALFVFLAISLVVVLPNILGHLGFGTATELTLSLIRWPVLLIGIILGLALIYRFGPCRDNAQWHWITVGSAVASILWIVWSMLFSYYAANFGSYNKTVRLARRDDRFHDLDVAVSNGRSRRRRNRRRA
jgi:membrane protein